MALSVVVAASASGLDRRKEEKRWSTPSSFWAAWGQIDGSWAPFCSRAEEEVNRGCIVRMQFGVISYFCCSYTITRLFVVLVVRREVEVRTMK
jgi:hypothetical protein